jgi:hypothetical protein
MFINVRGVDAVASALDNEFRLAVLEKVVSRLMRLAPPGSFTEQDFDNIRAEVLTTMQRKYPSAGLCKK